MEPEHIPKQLMDQTPTASRCIEHPKLPRKNQPSYIAERKEQKGPSPGIDELIYMEPKATFLSVVCTKLIKLTYKEENLTIHLMSKIS
jgi:hypothetical protein